MKSWAPERKGLFVEKCSNFCQAADEAMAAELRTCKAQMGRFLASGAWESFSLIFRLCQSLWRLLEPSVPSEWCCCDTDQYFAMRVPSQVFPIWDVHLVQFLCIACVHPSPSYHQLSTSGLETCAGDVNAPVVSVLASERMFSQRLMRLRLRVIGGEIMLKWGCRCGKLSSRAEGPFRWEMF